MTKENRMRIAVPTDDGVTLSGHFGRSAAFLVFEVADGQIVSRETRPNQPHHGSGTGECGQGGHGGGQGHSHAGIVGTLAGCQVVLCGGMGWRAAEALKAAGLSVVPVSRTGPAEELVAAYVKGALPASQNDFCRCSH
jgi:predicted Fe-Mo cluster-binding NifX family protein